MVVRRKLFNLAGGAAALSLALCAAMAVLWTLTDHRTRLVSWSRGDCGYVLRADAGRFCFERLRFAATLTPHQGGWSFRLPGGQSDDLTVIPENRTFRNGYGFEWDRARFVMDGLPASFGRLAVPFWPLIALCSVPASARLLGIAAQWRRRRLQGLCPTCGYDLRATPDRCPECGTVLASANSFQAGK